MDIFDKIEYDDYKQSHNNFSLIWKTYQILREGLIVSDEELDNLIDNHNKNEDYELSDKLSKLKTII